MNHQMTFDQLTRPSAMRLKFEAFHADNPDVYRLFSMFAFKAIHKGAEKIGARLIWERMRWHVKFDTTEHDFKLNDHYIAHYARLFLARHQEHEGIFELRAIKGGER